MELGRSAGAAVLLAVMAGAGHTACAAENEPLEGWHAANYYGFHQKSIPDFWDELCDVYGDGELEGVFEDEHGLWEWGYPLGYSIGVGQTQCWPFGPGPRCCLTPLYYREAAPAAFVSPRSEPARVGFSWYRTASVPAANGFHAVPAVSAAPAPAP